jgi:glycosyltransferase involved in cell wall biosynthesis
MSRDMVNAVVAMTEYNRFSKGIFGWIGFRTCWLPYENVERKAGKTKWSVWKLTKYAFDGIFNFSHAPLKFVSGMGITTTIAAFVYIVYILIAKEMTGRPVEGWTSTVSIVLFLGGLQLFSIGIIGQYIARIFLETKNRPHFIIAEADQDDAIKIK